MRTLSVYHENSVTQSFHCAITHQKQVCQQQSWGGGKQRGTHVRALRRSFYAARRPCAAPTCCRGSRRAAFCLDARGLRRVHPRRPPSGRPCVAAIPCTPTHARYFTRFNAKRSIKNDANSFRVGEKIFAFLVMLAARLGRTFEVVVGDVLGYTHLRHVELSASCNNECLRNAPQRHVVHLHRTCATHRFDFTLRNCQKRAATLPTGDEQEATFRKLLEAYDALPLVSASEKNEYAARMNRLAQLVLRRRLPLMRRSWARHAKLA